MKRSTSNTYVSGDQIILGDAPPPFVPMPIIPTSSCSTCTSSTMNSEGQTSRRHHGRSPNRQGKQQGGGRDFRETYTPYNQPTFTPDETVIFSGPGGYISSSEWDESKLDRPSVKEILFTASFAIHDSHLLDLLSRHPTLLASLEALQLGDSETGNGGTLSDRAVQSFLSAAPNLRVLRLDACTALTDSTLTCAFQRCPRLEQVRLTGTDGRKGSVKGAAFQELNADPELCPGLKELVLYDQEQFTYDQRDLIALSKTREELAIKVGDTVGDGVADNMTAAFIGGGRLKTWMGGRIVHEDVDMGGVGLRGVEMPFCDVF